MMDEHPGNMLIDRRIALFVIVPIVACAYDQDADERHPDRAAEQDRTAAAHARSTGPGAELFAIDLIQRTCALYVAVRSGSLGGKVAFGRNIDDTMVRWNLCPSGTKVACAVAPTANGDTVEVGIPWAHRNGSDL